MIGVLFFLLGMVCWHAWRQKIEFCEKLTGQKVFYEGTLIEYEEKENGNIYVIRTKRIEDLDMRFRIRIITDSHERPALGSEVSGSGFAEAFTEAGNPGEYDEKNYQYGKGVYLLLENAECSLMKTHSFPVREWLWRFRQYASRIYDTIFDESNASLACAMVFGDKGPLDADIRELYRRNGIAHLIAISGLHLSMIGGTLYRVVRRGIGSYPVAAGVGISFIILYGIMTGLSGATLRAIIMLVLSIGADVSGRKYDGLTGLSLAFLIMLLGNPYQLTQAGFLLSFGVVLGILVVYPIWECLYPNTPKLVRALLLSFSVQLVITPVQLYYFYEIPLYGIVLNVVVVPVMSILLALLVGCVLMGCLFLLGAEYLAMPANGIFAFYKLVCLGSEKLPCHTLCTGRPSVTFIVCYYSILVLFLFMGYGKRKGCGLVVCAGLIMLCTVFFMPGRLLVTMFDVGQGDGIYIRTPGKHHILMDGGSSNRQGVGNYILKNGVKYYGADVLDYVFLSHSDSDHYSGLEELLQDDTVTIHNMVFPAVANPDDAYRKLEMLAREKQCRIYYMQAGDTLSLDGISFLCLNPGSWTYNDKNQSSLVLLMSYRDFDMLFTGDIDETVEKELVKQNLPSVDILKVAHHGSETSSSELFLNRINPVVSCISVGKKNRYGHPHPDTIKRLEQTGSRIFTTAKQGAIEIRTDGNRMEFQFFSQSCDDNN